MLGAAGLTVPDYIGQDGKQRPIRHANEYWDSYGIAVHESMRRGGDLVVFSRKGWFPSHIGVMLDAETYIHAPGRDGTRVETVALEFEEIVAADKEGVIYQRNPIGFKSPVSAIEQPSYRYHQAPI